MFSHCVKSIGCDMAEAERELIHLAYDATLPKAAVQALAVALDGYREVHPTTFQVVAATTSPPVRIVPEEFGPGRPLSLSCEPGLDPPRALSADVLFSGVGDTSASRWIIVARGRLLDQSAVTQHLRSFEHRRVRFLALHVAVDENPGVSGAWFGNAAPQSPLATYETMSVDSFETGIGRMVEQWLLKDPDPAFSPRERSSVMPTADTKVEQAAPGLAASRGPRPTVRLRQPRPVVPVPTSAEVAAPLNVPPAADAMVGVPDTDGMSEVAQADSGEARTSEDLVEDGDASMKPGKGWWPWKPDRRRRRDDMTEGEQASSLHSPHHSEQPHHPDRIADDNGATGSTQAAYAVDACDPPVPPTVDETVADASTLENRAVNGNLIVDVPSPMNKAAWHDPKRVQLPNRPPGRDVEVEYGQVGDLRVIAGSVRGQRHQHWGEPNQDAFAIARNENVLVVAVADGVGSAQYSAYGSAYMSQYVVDHLVRTLGVDQSGDEVEGEILRAMEGASRGVRAWQDGALFAPPVPSTDVDPADLSSTLTICVVPIAQDETGGRTVVCGYVGDSPCYVLATGGWQLVSARTKDGEIMDLATKALPASRDHRIEPEFRRFALGATDMVIVMSDGIGTALGSGNTPLGIWLRGRLRNDGLLLPRHWVDTMMFDRSGEDDDRSMVLVCDFAAMQDSPVEATTG